MQNIHPPMTPEQFIALLDALCFVGCCDRHTRKGEIVYTISLHEIHEGDAILSGEYSITESDTPNSA